MDIYILSFMGEFRVAKVKLVIGGDDRIFHPGEDLSILPAETRKAIEEEWTPEIIAAFKAHDDAYIARLHAVMERKAAERAKIEGLEARIAKLEAAVPTAEIALAP